MTKSKELSDEIKKSLDEIIHHFDDEDRSVRDRQIKQWRRLKLLWENVQHVYYSEVAHDWRIPESERGDDSDQGYYDKPVNVYRAYLESIIAALSVSVPAIICYPDDADNPLDITTARTGDKIAELIFKHIDAPILWLHALFVYCTEGMTACYTYPHESDEYGTYETKQYDESIEDHELGTCPFCQAEMYDKTVPPVDPSQPIQPQGLTPITNPNAMTPDGMIPDEQEEPDEFMPGPVMNQLEECQSCGRMVLPQKSQQSLTVTRLVGVTKHAKSRVCMEVFGGLFVKIPVWARNQADCSYLIYSYETHYSNAMAEFPDYRDKITRGGAGYDMYEQWGRTSPQYRGEHPINNVTVRKVWLRPSAYNVVNDDEMKDLIKDFPDGAKICIVDDCIVHAENASLDDSWTITKNPLSDFVHFDPLGVLLTSVQDITNDLISLTVQTIEHGIPQTFADPKVLDFKAYRDSEVIPGGIYPATPRSGKAISEGFYEVKTATLSQEVLPFAQKMQEIGQLVSGALPSLFGGQMSGSRTASEYSMSRSQALQRLQTTWKMLLAWWKEIFGKAIPLYIKIMVDDEKQVKKNEMGNFVNVFIRKSELEGKIGSVELEANENLPITWNQQKDAIMELFKLNNEGINATLATPENMPYLRRAIGLTDYVIPGEDDRNKEYEEIEQLINSEPIEMPPDPMMVQQAQMNGMPPPPPQRLPSVEIDPDLDNHQLASDIDRRWLVSDAGRLCKLENPPGYENVLLHMKAHTMVIQQRQMMAQQQQMQQQMAMHPPPSQGNGGSAPKPPSGAGQETNNAQPTIQ
jgi:hypothetical protein